MVKLVDVVAMSAKVAHGFSLSEEELLAVEEWYASLDTPSADYHVAELNRWTSTAASRLLSDADVKRIVWHVDRLCEIVPPHADMTSPVHPVLHFITEYVRATRPTPTFGENFRKLNPLVISRAASMFPKAK